MVYQVNQKGNRTNRKTSRANRKRALSAGHRILISIRRILILVLIVDSCKLILIGAQQSPDVATKVVSALVDLAPYILRAVK